MAMKISDQPFDQRVQKNIENDFMRNAVQDAQERLRKRRLEAAEELGNWEEWRSLGEQIRKHTLENLDYYLHQLSENVAKRGGHVFFCSNSGGSERLHPKRYQEKKRLAKLSNRNRW